MSEEQLQTIRKSRKRFYDLQFDLQNSRHHNFAINLNAYVDFCENDDVMAKITDPLKTNQITDVQKWWDEISKTGGSFVGSKSYVLPVDLEEQASLLYKFLMEINNGTFDVLTFGLNVYGYTNLDENIREFNHDITKKLNRTLNNKLLALEETVKEEISSHKIPTALDKKRVFVVHGRNMKARQAMFSFLRSIGLSPIEWSQAVNATNKPSPYVGEVLDAAFSMAQAIVVLMTPDDEAKLCDEFISTTDGDAEKNLTGQPRQNVLFEAGMAMGYDQNRTILVELGNLRHFSDILGRHTIRINNTPERRNEFIQRLRTAKCDLDITGVDWLREGDFDGCFS